jgi:hypothetical protein
MRGIFSLFLMAVEGGDGSYVEGIVGLEESRA